MCYTACLSITIPLINVFLIKCILYILRNSTNPSRSIMSRNLSSTIVADELYEVHNKNAGMADREYYGKKEYDEKFHLLWRSLQREKLVKHSLEELENSRLI